jgi:histidinol-phosphate aminotransferase
MSRFLSRRFESLEAYVPGEQPQDMQYIKLNTNEAPFPPSPAVFERMNVSEIRKLNLYPDPEGKTLRKKLAGLYGVRTENVFLSNGSDEVLAFAFMAFCDTEKQVVFPDITYPFYPVYANLYGIPFKQVPVREDFTVDASDYMGVGKNIVIANPCSPTGLAIRLAEIEKILQSNPDHLVLIDEAYVDFGAESVVGLIDKYDNLLVVQTYSKSRFMAGVRLGVAFGSEGLIIDLNKMKYSFNPYNVSRMALTAGEAAVDEDAYYKENCRKIVQTREQSAAALQGLGFVMTDSKANFLFARHPDFPGKTLYLQLKERGILVRHFDKPRISDYLRITIGTPDQMEKLTETLRDILGKK